MAKRVSKSKISYTDAVTELEQIVERLRTSALGVDELGSAVKRAKELIVECKSQLTHAKTELDSIINEPQEM